MMKYYLIGLFNLLLLTAQAQYPEGGSTGRYRFKGSVVLKDGTEKKGWLTTYNFQKGGLSYSETEEGDTVHFPVASVVSYRMYPNYYQTMRDVKIYAHEWGMYNKLTTVKEIFAQVVNTGAVNIYAFIYNGLDTKTDCYLHTCFIFERKTSNGIERAPFPIQPRCTAAQYEKAKEPALKFFAAYPEILALIKAHTREKKVHELVQLIREIE